MIPINYVNETPEQFEMADFHFQKDRDSLLKCLERSDCGTFLVVKSNLPFPIMYDLLVNTGNSKLHVPISVIGNSYEAENERFSSLKLLIDFYVRSGVLINAQDGRLCTSMTPCEQLKLVRLTAPLARSLINSPSDEAKENIATLHEPNWPARVARQRRSSRISTHIRAVSEWEEKATK